MTCCLLLIVILCINSKQALCLEESLKTGKQLLDHEVSMRQSEAIHEKQATATMIEDSLKQSTEKFLVEDLKSDVTPPKQLLDLKMTTYRSEVIHEEQAVIPVTEDSLQQSTEKFLVEYFQSDVTPRKQLVDHEVTTHQSGGIHEEQAVTPLTEDILQQSTEKFLMEDFQSDVTPPKQLLDFEMTTYRSEVIHEEQAVTPVTEDSLQQSTEKFIMGDFFLKIHFPHIDLDSLIKRTRDKSNRNTFVWNTPVPNKFFNFNELDSQIKQAKDESNRRNAFDWNELNQAKKNIDWIRKIDEENKNMIKVTPKFDLEFTFLPTTPESKTLSRRELKSIIKISIVCIFLIIAALVALIKIFCRLLRKKKE